MTPKSAPNWMREWPWSSPRPTGPWTLRNGTDYALLDPETATITPIEPATDPKLPGITAALTSGGQLVSYRYQRRAITKHDTHFTKIVRPSRVTEVVDRHRLVSSNDLLETPQVINAHADGRIELTTVDGTTIHHRIRARADLPLNRIAAALAAFHRQTDRSGSVASATLDDPARWIETVCRIEPSARRQLQTIAQTLPAVDISGDNLIHTDLHDKNLVLTADGVGLIDLDGTRAGAPEVDIANLAVHLELRAIQAGDPPPVGRRRAQQLITHYNTHRPLDATLLEALDRHTWFRLACLYRCRTADRTHTATLLDRARGPSDRAEQWSTTPISRRSQP